MQPSQGKLPYLRRGGGARVLHGGGACTALLATESKRARAPCRIADGRIRRLSELPAAVPVVDVVPACPVEAGILSQSQVNR